MRTSNDIYKLENGKFLAFGQDVYIPQGAKIWTGYDYKNQAWVKNGRYLKCGHPENMDCNCFGKINEGKLVK